MALKDLTVDQVSSLLEEHEFPYDYERTEWSTGKKVRVTGVDQGWNLVEENISWGDRRLVVPGLGTVTLVDSYGGEGQGDSYWIVFQVDDGETKRVFKRDGWYASHDGSYLDGPTTEVKPVLKTITVWE